MNNPVGAGLVPAQSPKIARPIAQITTQIIQFIQNAQYIHNQGHPRGEPLRE